MAIRAAGDRIKEAIRTGKAEILQLSTDDLNRSIGPEGFAPLHWACHYGQIKVLQKIIDSGADVFSTTKCGWSGLHISAIRGQTDCFQVLLDAGVDPAQPDIRGYTPMHLSAAHGSPTILQILLRAGLDPNIRDARGWTPASHAAFHGRLGALQTLIQMGADMMLKDSNGCTPVHHAAIEGHTDCLKLLVTNTTELIELLHTKNNDGLTPLNCALQYHKTHSTEYLRSIEHEIISPKTECPAYKMCCRGDLTSMKTLIDQGVVGVNDRDGHGDTLAHKAAIHGQLECLMWLVKNGADVSLVNNLGETPYDLAIQHRHRDCSDFIARSMRLAYSFWRIPTWNQYLHRMDYPVPRGLEEYHPWGPKDHPWGRNNHPWGPGNHPWGPERHLWGTKVPYEAVPKYCYQHRSPWDHYKCPDDILWTELETEEQRRCVSELKTSLHYERQRRELLEGELDTMRRQLHLIRLQHTRTASPQTMPDSTTQAASPQTMPDSTQTMPDSTHAASPQTMPDSTQAASAKKF